MASAALGKSDKSRASSSSSVASPSVSSTSTSTSTSSPPSTTPPYGAQPVRVANDIVTAEYLRVSVALVTVQVLLILVTGGVLALPMLWSVRFRCRFRMRCSASLAESVLACDVTGRWAHVRVQHDANNGGTRFIEFKCLRYAYDAVVDAFVPPRAMGVGELSAREVLTAVARVKDSARVLATLSASQQQDEAQWRAQAGENALRVAMGSLVWAVLREVLGPVYIYQYLCVVLWLLHDYIAFGIIIVVLIWASAAYDLFLRRKNRARVRALAAYRVPVRAWTRGASDWRDGVDSTALLPGDVVQLTAEALPWTAPCDLALVQGALSVDEASLTGESLPVVKTPPESNGADAKRFEAEKEKRTSVYSGTQVLSVAEDRATLMVTRTGFQTAKGQLLRTILHTTTTEYTYEREARIFVGVLAGVGAVFFMIGLWLWGVFEPNGFQPKKLLFAFETIAILVPPMLPLVFHVGLLLSARALQEAQVFTTAPGRIPGAGTVRTFCFDKTGTLTKSDLDVIGAIAVKLNGSSPEFSRLQPLESAQADLARSVAACHQLAVLPGSHSEGSEGLRYSGPAIDVKLFTALQSWRYEEATFSRPARVLSTGGDELELLRRCEFEHALQRMCVVSRHVKTGALSVVAKGSVEAMATVCEADSLPKDLQEVAKDYARNGCYVLAVARRDFPSGTDASALAAQPRPQLETRLRFAGLLLLRNELKSDSREAIVALKRGRIRPLMVTGDNIFTAFYIARACGMISSSASCWVGDVEHGAVVFRALNDHSRSLPLDDRLALSAAMGQGAEFGVTSAAYDRLRERGEQGERALQHFLTERVRIFARMKPLQKESVVSDLMAVGHVTGMCGDGANDCAALSKAHCGVALSEAEASLVSSFTARSLSCAACVDLVREGRSSLDNSFAAFRFTILYGIVQVTQALLCYCYGSDLSQGMYILIDFVYFAPVMFFIVKSRAVAKLKGNPPASNVFGPTTLASILGSVLVALAAFFVTLYAIAHEPWYKQSVRRGPDPVFMTPETTSLFLVGAFVYAGAGVAYGWGGRWRLRFWHNAGLTVCALLVVATALVLLFLDDRWDVGVRALLQMFELPLGYRLLLLLVGAIAFVDLLLFELLVVTGPVANFLRRATLTGRKPQLDDEDAHDEPLQPQGQGQGQALDKGTLLDTAVALEEQDDLSDEDEDEERQDAPKFDREQEARKMTILEDV